MGHRTLLINVDDIGIYQQAVEPAIETTTQTIGFRSNAEAATCDATFKQG